MNESYRRPVFEQFFAVRRFFGQMAFSPDGSELAYITDTTGQFNAWTQGTEQGCARQMTVFDNSSARSVAYSPDGSTLLVLADQNGDEQHQLYALPAAGGWPQPLTSNLSVQHTFLSEPYSPDGRWIAYASNEREQTQQDVWLLDARSGEKRLAKENGFLLPVSWSPDGRYLTILNAVSNSSTELYLYDAEDGEARQVLPHEEEEYQEPGPWKADGSGFYLLTDRGAEFKRLAFYSLADGELHTVDQPDWDVQSVHADAAGKYLAWIVNENGRSRLYVQRQDSGERVDVPELPHGVITVAAFSADGSRLAFRFNQAANPNNVYVLELESGELRKLTESMLGGLQPEELAAPELISYRSFDRDIPAWLYRPREASADAQVPCVLSIHGGPEDQENAAYNPLYQYLLSRGIAVLAPNVRGSTGYGKSYQKLIHRDWGGGELRDLEAAARYLQGLDWIDPERLGVFGGSFGGFATLSCLTRLPEYWAAGVDIVGPSNLATFVRAVPPTWRRFMADMVGDPDEDSEMLAERSPITHIDRLRAPLLVIQGAKDPRVVKSESDQMVEALRERGVDVEYLVYEDEGHGFTRRMNQVSAFKRTAEFLQERLTGKVE